MIQPLYMDSTHHDLNFYDFSGNIAALLDDSRQTTFLIGYNARHLNGAFHLPFDAESVLNHDFFFWSLYPISENDLFKGYFGYNDTKETDVLWNDQAGMMETNPFLLGDSSRGSFATTGLYWAAEWAHRFSRHWQTGFGFFYLVDQRVKNVFPKPFNTHLHSSVTLSTQYAWDGLVLGFNYIYSNQKEEVKISRYNLEQNLTPLIYKFRYSDLPVILRGSTSEEREMILTGHDLSFQVSLKNADLAIMAEAGGRTGKSDTYDGGTERLAQGSFDIRDWRAKLKIDMGGRFYAMYVWQDWLLKASHPLFQELNVVRRNLITHQLMIGTKFSMLTSLPVFADLSYANNLDAMDDPMTLNAWRIRQHLTGARFGLELPLAGRFSLKTWAVYYLSWYDQISRTENRYTVYYDVLYRDKLDYYSRHDNSGGLGMNVLYNYRPLLEVELSFFYLKKMAKLELYRENWLFSFWIKLFVL